MAAGKLDLDWARVIIWSILDAHPELSRTALARHVGLAPSTVTRALGDPHNGTPARRGIGWELAAKLDAHLVAPYADSGTREKFLLVTGLADVVAVPTAPAFEPLAHNASVDPGDSEFASLKQLSRSELIELAHAASRRADWLGAERLTLLARRSTRVGSLEWADITLTAAVWREQMGDVVVAEQHILEVERECVDRVDVDRRDPRILALLTHRRGWLACEQYGQYRFAARLFERSRHYARSADDTEMIAGNLHFAVRALTERLTTEDDAWIGVIHARPRGRNPDADTLREIIGSDVWRSTQRADDVHHLHQEFNTRLLVSPGTALRVLQEMRDPATLHIRKLAEARWQVSSENWEAARAAVRIALAGYCALRFPAGIALAAAIEGTVQLRLGLRTRRDIERCLDCWVVCWALRPFEEHPLHGIAVEGLAQTVKAIRHEHARILREYATTLQDRVDARQGALDALAAVDVPLAPVAGLLGILLTGPDHLEY